jgi:hypothetical protein
MGSCGEDDVLPWVGGASHRERELLTRGCTHARTHVDAARIEVDDVGLWNTTAIIPTRPAIALAVELAAAARASVAHRARGI